MRFFLRKRRPTPTVIIVALIDVLIVLVIFLIATTTFKQQPALRLSLPESSQAERTGPSELAPLVVSIDPEGNLRLGADNLPVTIDDLKNSLVDQLARNPQLTLAINADEKAPLGRFVKVRDVAVEAGIKSLVVFTKETGPR